MLFLCFIAFTPLPRCQTFFMRSVTPPCIVRQNAIKNGNQSPPLKPSVQKIKTVVITDPKTGQNLNIEELASSKIEDPLEESLKINNLVLVLLSIFNLFLNFVNFLDDC